MVVEAREAGFLLTMSGTDDPEAQVAEYERVARVCEDTPRGFWYGTAAARMKRAMAGQ